MEFDVKKEKVLKMLDLQKQVFEIMKEINEGDPEHTEELDDSLADIAHVRAAIEQATSEAELDSIGMA
jgi:hypothetical protein